jgi:hypothetical protein
MFEIQNNKIGTQVHGQANTSQASEQERQDSGYTFLLRVK